MREVLDKEIRDHIVDNISFWLRKVWLVEYLAKDAEAGSDAAWSMRGWDSEEGVQRILWIIKT